MLTQAHVLPIHVHEIQSKKVSRVPYVRPAHRSPVPVRLQRSPCACGGGCPRCAGESHHARSETVGAVANGLQSPGPGQPLDNSTQEFMESRFGHDFSDVRVHTDARAAESARAVNAQAYTVGRNIVFGGGQYAPTNTAGRHLISHELTHVVQQVNASRPAQALQVASDTYEHEADQVANAIESGRRVSVSSRASEHQLARFSVTGHHVIEEAALTGAGFTEEQIRGVQRGNLQRDFSQLPTVANAVLLCKHDNFGGYRPQEHFDNYVFDAVTNRWRSRGVSLNFDPLAFAKQDPKAPDRTAMTYIESELTTLANTGMTDSGLEHLGNAFHTVEDFFAHSNFVELINNKGLGNQTLLTGSVPLTDFASVAHILAGVTGPGTQEHYEQQAEALTAKAEQYSHARMSHDIPGTRNYEQARRLAALVIQDLGVDILAAMRLPSAAQRLEVMTSTVLPKIHRYLRPPDPNDKWWERLTALDKGDIDVRLEQAARRTPVTVNQCVISPLANLEASRYSPWKMPLGVAKPMEALGGTIWFQAGLGVTSVLPDRPLPDPTTTGEGGAGAVILGGQITGTFP